MKKYYYICFVVLVLFCASCVEKTSLKQQSNLDTLNIQKIENKDNFSSWSTLFFNAQTNNVYTKVVLNFFFKHKGWTDELIITAAKDIFGVIAEAHIVSKKKIKLYENEALIDLYLIDYTSSFYKKTISCLIDRESNSIFYFDYDGYYQ